MLAYWFVYRESDLVESWLGFFGLAGVLVAVAFLFSAVEAAFSVANRDSAVSAAMVADLAKIEGEYAGLAAKATEGIGALTRRERKRRNRLEKRSTRLQLIRRTLNSPGGRRIDIVGSLSALSVLINTALAAFLPLFLIDAAEIRPVELVGLSLDRQKVMTFVATALPIIYLGKIVPKTVGVRYPVQFAYRFFAVGNGAFYLIGWMPRGLHWLLIRLRLLR
jgi:hypothetical protein